MDIQTSKIELIKIILNIENDSVIQKLTEFIKSEEADFWNELTENQKDDIRKGIKQLDDGKRKPYEDVLKDLS